MGVFKDILARLDRIQADIKELKDTVSMLRDGHEMEDIAAGLGNILSYDGRGEKG